LIRVHHIKFQPTKALSFNLAAQSGTDNQLGNTSNALTNVNLGQISSNFVGVQCVFNYDWFGVNLAYNSVWGSSSAYGNGAIVTYTVFSTALAEWNGTQEYDFVVNYNLPQIKGLTLFGVYSYQQVPNINNNGSTYITQLYVSYLY